MKKFFYLFFILFFLFACKTNDDIAYEMSPDSAKDIYLSYLTVKQDEVLVSHFSGCNFEYKEKNYTGAFTCTVAADENKDYIFVISNSPQLKGEVNLTKKDVDELVYIAHLNIDKNLKKMSGEKLLFSIKDNLIIDNQEIKQHF